MVDELLIQLRGADSSPADTMERRHETVSRKRSQRYQTKDPTAAESEMITFDVRPFRFAEDDARFSRVSNFSASLMYFRFGMVA